MADDNETTIPGELEAIHQRLTDGERRMQAMERNQVEIRDELRLNTEITGDIRSLMHAARLGFKVLGGLGVLVKWLLSAGAAAAAIWTAFYVATHGGTPPK